jgi:hypothetical protein
LNGLFVVVLLLQSFLFFAKSSLSPPGEHG